MFRIDHPTAVAVKPAPGAAGTPGFFTEGDPVGGIVPTVVTQAWCNGVQEELISILTAASIAPDKAAANQVLTALQALFLRTSNFTGSNQSLASSGYQKLPGGLIIQWATGFSAVSGYSTHTFPIAFPNAPLALVANASGNSYVTTNGFVGKTGCSLGTSPAGGVTFNYIVIGF